MDEWKEIPWETMASKTLRQMQFHMEADGAIILRLEFASHGNEFDRSKGEQLALEIQPEQLQYLSESLLRIQEFFAPKDNMKN